MLCEICGENEATFHYSEVVNGNKTEHHLCSECAAKTDIICLMATEGWGSFCRDFSECR